MTQDDYVGTGKPSVTASRQILPFGDLDPATFERLCLWLIEAEGFEQIEHYGAAGTDFGRDIVAYRRKGDRLQPWVFQCKKRSSVGAQVLKRDVDRVHSYRLFGDVQQPILVFITSAQISARAREEVRSHAASHGYTCHFWARTELDQRVKRHSTLLLEFFQLPTTTRVGAASSVRRWRRPKQLPAAIANFAGRRRELGHLQAMLQSSTKDASDGSRVPDLDAPSRVLVLTGPPGIGKTALALQFAHHLSRQFPDGQLFMNLRGYDRDAPMLPGDALAAFLGALGEAGQDIPVETEERAALYRTILSGKRLLVVLDNARDSEHVRSLLPGSGACLSIVTSRDSLAGLVVERGAQRLEIGYLAVSEAESLLRSLIGERVTAEPIATTRLIQHCGRLPLTLRVAAELAATRPSARLANLVNELEDEKRRLHIFDLAGDERTAVRTVFSWSYRHLPATIARGFRLLGWHHGPELSVEACGALLDVSLDEAGMVLTTLARAHLVEPRGVRHFGMHDLIRAYASELADAEDGQHEWRTTLSRLFSHYLETAGAAMDVLVPAERHRRSRDPERVNAGTPRFAEPKEARAWLEEERPTLVVASTVTAIQGWPAVTTRLATTLYRFFEIGGHYADALKVHANARRAALETGNRHEEAWALTNIGVVFGQLGRPLDAGERHKEALCLFRRLKDRDGEARSLTNLGLVYWRRGEYRRAETCHRQAKRLFESIGDGVGVGIALTNTGNALRRRSEYESAISSFQEALTQFGDVGDDVGASRALTNLGVTLWRLGENEVAERLHERALRKYRSVGHAAGEADALDNLGLVELRRGRYDAAYKHHFAALRLSRQIGDRYGESDALLNLGVVRLRQHKVGRAERLLVDALNLYCDIGDRGGESRALNDLGRLLLERGLVDAARHRHECALELARHTGDRYEQARAHDGLAQVHRAKGHLGRARLKWRTASSLFSVLGVPEAVHTKKLSEGPVIPRTQLARHPK